MSNRPRSKLTLSTRAQQSKLYTQCRACGTKHARFVEKATRPKGTQNIHARWLNMVQDICTSHKALSWKDQAEKAWPIVWLETSLVRDDLRIFPMCELERKQLADRGWVSETLAQCIPPNDLAPRDSQLCSVFQVTDENRADIRIADKFQCEFQEDKEDADKQRINDLVARLVRDQGDARFRALVLDGPDLRTSRILSVLGMPCLVVNPELDYDSKTWPDLVCLHRGTMLEFLVGAAQRHAPTLGHLMLDYCSRWESRRHSLPKQELRLALCQGMLARDGGILWITVSLRGVPDPDTYLLCQVVPDVLRIGDSFHYDLVLEHAETYRGKRMGCVVFRGAVPP